MLNKMTQRLPEGSYIKFEGLSLTNKSYSLPHFNTGTVTYSLKTKCTVTTYLFLNESPPKIDIWAYVTLQTSKVV